MRVELIYDKRNVGSLANATEIIRAELTKRVHRVFPMRRLTSKRCMPMASIPMPANKKSQYSTVWLKRCLMKPMNG